MLRTAPPRMRVASHLIARIPPKTADPYYLSQAHRQWRRRVIAASGGACQQCGRTGTRLFADHIREIKDGGDPQGPGRALCGACHVSKTNQERAKRVKNRY